MKLFVNGVQDGSTATNSSNITTGSTYGATLGRWVEISDPNYFVGYLSSVRAVKGTAVYTSDFTPPTSPLTAISGTSLLTCQSNRFIDNSTNNFTITKNGDTRVVAFSPFNPSASWSAATYGGSGYFDGSGDYLTAPNNAAFDLGSGDFTVESWVYLSSLSNQIIVTRANNSSTYPTFELGISGSTARFYSSSTGSSYNVNLASSIVPVLNSWNHLAVTRSGSTFTIWVNGVSGGTATSALSLVANSNNLGIGAYPSGEGVLNAGYLSNLRIVKGTAVYTSTFTPPTAPLTAITNTSLLLNFTNAGIYDATSKNDLETVGNAQISTAISAKWGSGSMYFDGTGDYLLTQSSNLLQLGTGQFTIEAWFYKTASTGGNVFSSKTGPGNDSTSIGLYVDATLMYVWGNGAQITASSPSLNAWHYVAITRNSSNLLTLWLNGSSVGTLSSFTADLSKDKFAIGALTNGTETFFGYIQDLRITKGYARTITTPTAAFPTL